MLPPLEYTTPAGIVKVEGARVPERRKEVRVYVEKKDRTAEGDRGVNSRRPSESRIWAVRSEMLGRMEVEGVRPREVARIFLRPNIMLVGLMAFV